MLGDHIMIMNHEWQWLLMVNDIDKVCEWLMVSNEHIDWWTTNGTDNGYYEQWTDWLIVNASNGH